MLVTRVLGRRVDQQVLDSMWIDRYHIILTRAACFSPPTSDYSSVCSSKCPYGVDLGYDSIEGFEKTVKKHGKTTSSRFGLAGITKESVN